MPEPFRGWRRWYSLALAGQIRVEISETFPLAEAAAAHERSEAGHVRGKLVLTVA